MHENAKKIFERCYFISESLPDAQIGEDEMSLAKKASSRRLHAWAIGLTIDHTISRTNQQTNPFSSHPCLWRAQDIQEYTVSWKCLHMGWPNKVGANINVDKALCSRSCAQSNATSKLLWGLDKACVHNLLGLVVCVFIYSLRAPKLPRPPQPYTFTTLCIQKFSRICALIEVSEFLVVSIPRVR